MKRCYALIAVVVVVGMSGRPVLGDFVSDTRTAVERVVEGLEHKNSAESRIWNYDIRSVETEAYLALARVVSNDWRSVLASLPLCATNQLERLLILGVRDRFGHDFYIDYLDVLVDMKTNGVISAQELGWAQDSEVPSFSQYFAVHYQDDRVRQLVRKFEIAEPGRDYWRKVLTGDAYTNYLLRVDAGL